MGSNCATWVPKPRWQIKQRLHGGISSGFLSTSSFICLLLSTWEYHCVQIRWLGLQEATVPLTPAPPVRVTPVMSNYIPGSQD